MAHLRELPDAEPCSLHARVDQKTEIVSRMLGIGFGGISKAANEADEVTVMLRRQPSSPFSRLTILWGMIYSDSAFMPRRLFMPSVPSRQYCLLVPQIPMLFMGDEWGASTPFPFFCDYEGDTGQRAREGRMKFLQKNLQVEGRELVRVPDPLAEQTFRSAHLDWNELSEREHAEWLHWYREILKVRRSRLSPC